jgi:hypothetical protein
MPGKRIEFDRETLHVLEQLADDRMATIQELVDEAITDLLKKHGRPVGLKAQLKQSVKEKKVVRLKPRGR